MNKQLTSAIILIVLVAGVIFFINRKTVTPAPVVVSTATTSPDTSVKQPSLLSESWNTFESYMTAAKNHDLQTVTKLSYKLSAACKDPAQLTACYQKMDTAYTAGKDFTKKDFTQIVSNNKQIIIYTDWNTVYDTNVTIAARSLIYFVRSSSGAPLILSFNPSQAEFISHTNTAGKPISQAQIDGAVASTTKADDIALTKDNDGNGWWDSIQQYFY